MWAYTSLVVRLLWKLQYPRGGSPEEKPDRKEGIPSAKGHWGHWHYLLLWYSCSVTMDEISLLISARLLDPLSDDSKDRNMGTVLWGLPYNAPSHMEPPAAQHALENKYNGVSIPLLPGCHCITPATLAQLLTPLYLLATELLSSFLILRQLFFSLRWHLLFLRRQDTVEPWKFPTCSQQVQRSDSFGEPEANGR